MSDLPTITSTYPPKTIKNISHLQLHYHATIVNCNSDWLKAKTMFTMCLQHTGSSPSGLYELFFRALCDEWKSNARLQGEKNTKKAIHGMSRDMVNSVCKCTKWIETLIWVPFDANICKDINMRTSRWIHSRCKYSHAADPLLVVCYSSVLPEWHTRRLPINDGLISDFQWARAVLVH